MMLPGISCYLDYAISFYLLVMIKGSRPWCLSFALITTSYVTDSMYNLLS